MVRWWKKKLFNHDNFSALRAEKNWMEMGKMLNTRLRVSIACYLWSMEFSENFEFWNFIMNSASLFNLGSFNCDLCRQHANGNFASIHRSMRWERNDDDEFLADDTKSQLFWRCLHKLKEAKTHRWMRKTQHFVEMRAGCCIMNEQRTMIR